MPGTEISAESRPNLGRDSGAARTERLAWRLGRPAAEARGPILVRTARAAAWTTRTPWLLPLGRLRGQQRR